MSRPRLILALTLVLASAGGALAQVTSSFDSNAEGWAVRDLNCTNYAQVYATHAVTWQSAGGDPGGHVVHHDVSSYCSFFAAPATYLGDRTDCAGGVLEFSLTSTEFDWQDSDVVVLIGSGLVICSELPVMPPQPPNWRHYTIPLAAGEFTYGSAAGATVSAVDFAAVLADLEVLLLPAEFGAQVEETVGLDTVRLLPPGSPVPDVPTGLAFQLNAHPNPFNPRTTVSFTLPAAGQVQVAICDARGQMVARLVSETLVAGAHTFVWEGRDNYGASMPSGTYFCRLKTSWGVEARKLQLVK
jgi:hypothetical protein